MKHSLLLLSLSSFCAASASAALLTGSGGAAPGTQLTLPSSTGTSVGAPGVSPVNSGLNYTWGAPANSAWHGTYTASAVSTAGFISFNFSGVGAGFLPANTYLRMSDLDSNEDWTLAAWDTSGNPVTTHWLTDAVYLGGANPADFIQAYMPSWTMTSGVYQFTGESITGNPTLLYVLQTGQALSRIELTRNNVSNSISFASGEVPEPATWTLLGAGLVTAGLARRRRNAAI
jgi:hypothetical protein